MEFRACGLHNRATAVYAMLPTWCNVQKGLGEVRVQVRTYDSEHAYNYLGQLYAPQDILRYSLSSAFRDFLIHTLV